MNNIAQNTNHKMFIILIAGWAMIIATVLFWSSGNGGESYELFNYVMFAANISTMVFIYIVNYTYIIPHHLFRGRRWSFLLLNVALIVGVLVAGYIFKKSDVIAAIRPSDLPPRPRHNYTFIFKDIIGNIMVVGLVTAFRLSERLQASEQALREAESARVKAELDNLRSQINPHFLLNTLNNIYALTAIDSQKAQKTIKELSEMLRYILYDNLNERVPLSGEVEFLKNYIELMSIRLPRKMVLTTAFDIEPNCSAEIAPLIFISLIENAFKHSVGSDGSGFINIHFSHSNKGVELTIENSNNAKSGLDKSGHGIGLGQVRRRLELSYPSKYVWNVAQDEALYRSQLIITLR